MVVARTFLFEIKGLTFFFPRDYDFTLSVSCECIFFVFLLVICVLGRGIFWLKLYLSLCFWEKRSFFYGI